MDQQTDQGKVMVQVSGQAAPEAAVNVATAAAASGHFDKVEIHAYPASLVGDITDLATEAWAHLPKPEKVLLKVALRATIALAVARFLAIEAHNTLVTFGQDVLRDPGVQSALAAVLQVLVGGS